MKRKLSICLFLPAMLVLFSTSCTKEATDDAPKEKLTSNSAASATAGFKKDKSDVLKSVKQATSRFHSTTQALKAGYQRDTRCVSHPVLGGMGYHWVNQSLIDPVFDPEKPEAVLYETGPDGNLNLVAVEYIVINTGQPRPMFGDHPLDIGGVPPLMAQGIPHWSLHVWLYKENPAGMFRPFNPTVKCP